MAFDPENIGMGVGGGGLLGALASYFGIKYRLDKQDERFDKQEQRFERLEDDVVFRGQHSECQMSNKQQFNDIKHWMEVISNDIKELMKK
jgi:hypothetical protein